MNSAGTMRICYTGEVIRCSGNAMANRMLLFKEREPRSRTLSKQKLAPKQRRAGLRAIEGGKKLPDARLYLIEWDAADELWLVFRDDGAVLGHAHELSPATELAIRAAEHDHGRGAEVAVFVQQRDGMTVLAWAPLPIHRV